MSLAKIATGVGLAMVGVNLYDRYVDKFWHFLKFYIPPENINVGFAGLSQFFIAANLKIENNWKLSIRLSNIHLTAYFKDKNGDLRELGSTPPSSKSYVISAKKTTIIPNIRLNILSLSSIKAIKTLLTYPAGQRFKLVITGDVQGFSFTQEVWY